MAELIEYARTLSEEIGPRPATTDAEHRAAEWLERAFAARGLPTEMQEFDAPHTMSWSFVLYHLLTFGSAFCAGFSAFPSWRVWPAFAVSAIAAFFLWSDLDTHWGLSRILPKGPSQNVIARYVPRARRGERLRRVVVVAHYDSARASALHAPGMVRYLGTGLRLTKWATYATPVLILLTALLTKPLPFVGTVDRWLWYVALVVAGYVLVPLVLNVHRELFMPFSPGANDNASGVAALLGVMERLVPEPDADNLVTGTFASVRRADWRAARDAGLVSDETEVVYRDAASAPDELPEDFRWAEARATTTISTSESDRSSTGGWSAVGQWGDMDDESSPSSASPVYADSEVEMPERRGGFLGGLLTRKRPRRDDVARPADWLGVGDDFDARVQGRSIGSWDNFTESNDDDDAGGLGWKGGWAGDDPIGDPDFAASEAARIRRRVTESVDRELMEKEVWFVATGAGEVGGSGMRALLAEHADELKDALIINLESCGVGSLCWASAEGKARRLRANARLVSLARRVSRETDTLIKPRILDGLATDSVPALVRGYKAMSIVAVGPHGTPMNFHAPADTIDTIDPAQLETVAEFVTAMIREG